MSVVTLRANSHLAVPVTRGILGSPAIGYHVESEHPTHAFAVNDEGLNAFRSGQNYNYWGTPNAANVPGTIHDYKGPDFPGLWYLVIVNYGAVPTAVYYRAPLPK